MKYPLYSRFRYLLLRSRYKKWIIPFLCSLPYLLSLLWLTLRGQHWIAQIMLAPIFMTFSLLILSFLLAKVEFRE